MKQVVYSEWANLSRKELSELLVCMKKIADKGGVVVMEENCLVTTYN